MTNPAFIEYEGFLVSTDGEVVGTVLPDGSYDLYSAAEGRSEAGQAGRLVWVPSTEADALYLMERRAGIVARIAAKKIQAQEALARIEADKKRMEADLVRFDWRFEADLFNLAPKLFPKGKKTWNSPFGAISFSKQSAKLKNADGDDAAKKRIDWARANCPETLEQPATPPVEFKISLLPADKKTALLGDSTAAAQYGFAIEPEFEKKEVKQ